MKYVVDTNFIISNLGSVIEFLDDNNQIILLDSVKNELDRLKNRSIDDWKKVRMALKFVRDNYNRFTRVKSPCNQEYADEDIICYCNENPDTIVLTNDIGLHIDLNFLGIQYYTERWFDPFFEDPVYYANEEDFENNNIFKYTCPNQYIVYENNNKTSVFIKKPDKLKALKVSKVKIKTLKKEISPLSLEQKMFINAFNQKDIELITVNGSAGSGKTFITLACQLAQVDSGKYNKIYISVPPVHIGGKDRYGFAPGTLEEKASNYLGGFVDNLKYITGIDEFNPEKIQIGKNIEIEILPFSTLRGRSFKNSIIILDEQQNSTQLELLTLLTRTDINSKVVLLGDISQTDLKHKYLNNDFAKTIIQFKDSELAQHIKMKDVMRQELAKEQHKRLMFL